LFGVAWQGQGVVFLIDDCDIAGDGTGVVVAGVVGCFDKLVVEDDESPGAIFFSMRWDSSREAWVRGSKRGKISRSFQASGGYSAPV
jgi:hypothetical protein